MEPIEPHFTVTCSETGKIEYRHLLTEKQFRFDLEMALRDCSAFSGTARGLRKDRTTMPIDSIIHHMRLSNLKVFGGMAESGRVPLPGGRKHLWKTDAEHEAEQRSYENGGMSAGRISAQDRRLDSRDAIVLPCNHGARAYGRDPARPAFTVRVRLCG